MYSIYSALTSVDSTTEGIKGMNVFYDTLFINFKSFDSDESEYVESVLIEKVVFDYTSNTIKTDSTGHLISFGDTGTPLPYRSTGNTFVDNILFEDRKQVLVCGLSSLSGGNVSMPVIYEYNISDDTIKSLYPKVTDLSGWSSFLMGQYLSAQTPVVSYNPDTHSLNFLVKTKIGSLDVINDIMFIYTPNELILTNVRQLTLSSIGTDFEEYDFVKFKNYGDNKKIVVSHKDHAVQVFTLL